MKAAKKSIWELRGQSLIDGLGYVATDEAPFKALSNDEAAQTKAECKKNADEDGCNDPAALGATRLKAIHLLRGVPSRPRRSVRKGCWAAGHKTCGPDCTPSSPGGAGGWDALGTRIQAKALASHVSEKDPDVRLSIIEEAEWVVDHSPQAAQAAKGALPAMDRQLADEKGNSDFVRVNEELRRLWRSAFAGSGPNLLKRRATSRLTAQVRALTSVERWYYSYK